MRSGLALALILGIASQAKATSLLIKNAHVVDPAAATVSLKNILIRDGRTAEILNAGSAPSAEDVFDAKKLWLIPGLTDMHTHSWGNDAPFEEFETIGPENTAKRMLYSGVTSFLDLGSPEDVIFPARERLRKGETQGAELLAAGSVFVSGKASRDGKAHVVNTQKEARAEVDKLASRKPDVVKVIFDYRRKSGMKREVMAAIVRQAKKHGLPAVVHIGSWLNAKHAAEAGAGAFTHLNEDEVVPDDVVKALKASGIRAIPTMAVQLETLNISESPGLLKAPLLVDVTSKELRSAYARIKEDPEMEYQIRWQKDGRINDKKSFEKLRAAGIPLLAGSDAANYGSFQGYSLHRELVLFTENGASRWEALRAATTEPDAFFKRVPPLAPGGWANFVLLKRNPADDITATQEIAEVFYRGRKLDRPALLKSSFNRSGIEPASSGK
ncbi:MAG TPA: amidohydrolase family protein [Bdellovibrionales bacterium]|nr:amidohydrolase family protein [Bdellovibrionales bacterium]